MTKDEPEVLTAAVEQLLKKLSNNGKDEIPEYMNTRQAAAYLGLSTQFLEISRCRGGGPRYCKLAQAVRYCKSDLDAFMHARRKNHTAEASHV